MIIFRADGNSKIGSGHVMRCLSIAREASKTDDVIFLAADQNFKSTIKGAGVPFYSLDTRYDHLDDELPKITRELAERKPSAIFIDSYFVTEQYLSEVKKACNEIRCRLIYIDDLISFPYACDYLINYNIFGPDKREDYKQLYAGKKLPRLLLGPKYVPLREEFANLPSRIVKNQVENIFISTGGADPEHIAVRLIKEIIYTNLPYRFHFVIGTKNNDFEKIKKILDHAKTTNIVLHRNVKKMAALMSACDIAISAAGSTLYELCVTQTPTLTYVLADNQISGAEGFEKYSIGIYLGDYRYKKNFTVALLYELNALANDVNQRKKLASNMKKIVDGNGTTRILREIIAG